MRTLIAEPAQTVAESLRAVSDFYRENDRTIDARPEECIECNDPYAEVVEHGMCASCGEEN